MLIPWQDSQEELCNISSDEKQNRKEMKFTRLQKIFTFEKTLYLQAYNAHLDSDRGKEKSYISLICYNLI